MNSICLRRWMMHALVTLQIATLFGALGDAVIPPGRHYTQLVGVAAGNLYCATVDFKQVGNATAFQAVAFDGLANERNATVETGRIVYNGNIVTTTERNVVANGRFIPLDEDMSYTLIARAGARYTGLSSAGEPLVFSRLLRERSLGFERNLFRLLGLRVKRMRQVNCKHSPMTVDTLDVNAYLGAWLQVLGNRESLFFGATRCITALYTLNTSVSVNVLNSALAGERRTTVTGIATVENPLFAGQLIVRFPEVRQSGDGIYWIIALGPKRNEKYEWAIVSGPELDSLFVLTRNATRYASLYESNVMRLLTGTFGFNSDSIIETPQDSNCTYLPEVQAELPQ